MYCQIKQVGTKICLDEMLSLLAPSQQALNLGAVLSDQWYDKDYPLNLQGLQRLEDLVHKINDLLDNRVEANLQAISKMRLVDLPVDRSFTYEDFVATQAKFVKKQAEMLAVK